MDAFITAGGVPPAGPPSAPASSVPAASTCIVAGSGSVQLAAAYASAPANSKDPAAEDGAVQGNDIHTARVVDAKTGPVSNSAAEHSAAGSSAGANNAAHGAAPGGAPRTDGASSSGRAKPVNPKPLDPAFLLEEALRSMAGGNFAAARARLALCRTALLAQVDPTSDTNPESSAGPEGKSAEHDGRCGDAMPAAGSASNSALEHCGGDRGTANGRGGGGGVEPEVGDGRDVLACQLGAVCGSLVWISHVCGHSVLA